MQNAVITYGETVRRRLERELSDLTDAARQDDPIDLKAAIGAALAYATVMGHVLPRGDVVVQSAAEAVAQGMLRAGLVREADTVSVSVDAPGPDGAQ